MYVDRTDTLYNSALGRAVFCNYLRRYGFTGVYLYSTASILSSESNYTIFGDFLEELSASGVCCRAMAAGGSGPFQPAGYATAFNASQSTPSRRINRANLELEWWNGDGSWEQWNNANQQIAAGTIADNDFYVGWYRNMGDMTDTIAARDQVLYSDRILLHCYQNGIPTYDYANAQSSGATGGRLDIIASGARQANKRIDLYIIISAEDTAWGADNTFSGHELARAIGEANPFEHIEVQAYNNIYDKMTTFQKQWINLKGFVWFTKRYCYKAIPPR